MTGLCHVASTVKISRRTILIPGRENAKAVGKDCRSSTTIALFRVWILSLANKHYEARYYDTTLADTGKKEHMNR